MYSLSILKRPQCVGLFAIILRQHLQRFGCAKAALSVFVSCLGKPFRQLKATDLLASGVLAGVSFACLIG